MKGKLLYIRESECDYITQGKSWELQRLIQFIPIDIVRKIRNFLVQDIQDKNDLKLFPR